jgi:transcriptional regulator with XRE-family HTH domain
VVVPLAAAARSVELSAAARPARVTPLGRWIRQHRTDLGLTQNELAREVNVSPRIITHLECGTRNGLSTRVLLGLAVCFQRRDPTVDVSAATLLALVEQSR